MRTSSRRVLVTAAAAGAALLVLGGLAVMIADYREGGVFDIARLAVVLGGQLAVTAYFSGKRGCLDEAWQAGFQVGFYRGERVRPKIIRMDQGRARQRQPR